MFFVKDRANIPKVPSCAACNNEKSRLENYFLALVLAGSNHDRGDQYRKEFVLPRLKRNRQFQKAIDAAKPVVRYTGERFEHAYTVRIDSAKTTQLMEMIAAGLYHWHVGEPLPANTRAIARIFAPEDEQQILRLIEEAFPSDSQTYRGNLGDGAFMYEGIAHPVFTGLTLWRVAWHGGIPLAGDQGPPNGVDTWIVRTAPEDWLSTGSASA